MTTDIPTESVKCWREGGVAHIHFRRPDVLNAIDEALAHQFHAHVTALARDSGVRAVVLSGEGRAFMAGGDLEGMEATPQVFAARLMEKVHGAIRLLTEMDAPVIASVHGAVAGGGLGLMLASDICIAAENTRFSVAYPSIGASCDCGTSWSLERVVGLRKAMEILLLPEPIDAQTALHLDLVNFVVPEVELGDATRRLAQRLVEGPTLALGRIKRLLRHAGGRSLSVHLDVEAAEFLGSAGTADFREGIAAFREKRKPAFLGA